MNAYPQMALDDFLLMQPPGVQTFLIVDALDAPPHLMEQRRWEMNAPDLRQHCEVCDGDRVFRAEARPPVPVMGRPESLTGNFVLRYSCRNCGQAVKLYALAVAGNNDGTVHVQKIGELPPFGPPPMPSRMVSVFGPDRDLLLKGRRCESQGLGVGAFVYYRRIVENQRVRLFDLIIKALRVIEPVDAALIADLESAKAETQFSTAVESLKHAFPAALLVKGQNPLRLLHSALSEGVHALTDEECLALASDTRVVLTKMIDCVERVLADEREVSHAVARLNNVKSKAKGKPL